MNEGLIFGVSDFVVYLNQTLEIAYPFVTIEGELSNYRVSKNRWVYFDLKDDKSSVKFFGTVYGLPGPLEDGMIVRVSGSPRLHNLYGFSVNYQSIQPMGEGSLKRAATLLQAKLTAEGLFAEERKRLLPYPPKRIALITAGSSAAFADFIKISTARWAGLHIDHYDVLVQGDKAPAQIVQAITRANEQPVVPEVIVITRGGGSTDDLAAFNTEQVTRAVAGSRVPTLVAIGHEIDLSLAELAADRRASTPSNAAEFLTPDRQVALRQLAQLRTDLDRGLVSVLGNQKDWLVRQCTEIQRSLQLCFETAQTRLAASRHLIAAYDPTIALQRGYALVRSNGTFVRTITELKIGQEIQVQLSDGHVGATIQNKEKQHD